MWSRSTQRKPASQQSVKDRRLTPTAAIIDRPKAATVVPPRLVMTLYIAPSAQIKGAWFPHTIRVLVHRLFFRDIYS